MRTESEERNVDTKNIKNCRYCETPYRQVLSSNVEFCSYDCERAFYEVATGSRKATQNSGKLTAQSMNLRETPRNLT